MSIYYQIRNCFSKSIPLSCDVLQSSVLGPLLFTLHATPLSSLIRSHKLDYHLYADNTQVYISLTTADTYLSLTQLGDCLSDISGWMTNIRLWLNANKTYFSIISTSRQCSKFTHFFLTPILNHSITRSHTVSNLGFTFDTDFNFGKYISLTSHNLRHLPYSWPLTYSSLYSSFSHQNYCYSTHY